MERYLSTVLHSDGEGVMLRKPSSPYEQGRSSALVKIKVNKVDVCCTVGFCPRHVIEDKMCFLLLWKTKSIY